jgi:hypothetical protein
VQVHRQDPVDAHALQHVGHDFGGDGHAGRSRPPVLARIAEIRNGRGDPPGRRALQRIDHDHQFHQVSLVGVQVDCSTKTSLPRTFSRISTITSPSLKRPTVARRYGCSANDDRLGQARIGVAGKHHQALVRGGAGHVAKLGTGEETASHGMLSQCVDASELRWAPCGARARLGWGGRIRTFACRNQNPVP